MVIDLRRRSRGQQQRVRRVGDVVFTAGNGLDRRPAQPVPGKVQRRHRNPPIGDADSGQFCRKIGREPILPGAREEGNLVAAVLRQLARDLMDVFANAGAGPQGRPVVDDDPHAPEPITTLTRHILAGQWVGSMYSLC